MFEFSQEYLKPAMLMSLLTVWLLVCLFAYLNRYTRRQYFTIWTAAWLFYALWLTLGISSSDGETYWLTLTKQWCVGASAIFLLWGGLRFLDLRTPQRLFGLFIAFILVWSYAGTDLFDHPLLISGPVFGMLGVSSALNAWCFFRLRHRRPYLGASLLATGFLLWGVYLAAFPFFPLMGSWAPTGFFFAAVLQLFIAVSMIILVLEEARASNELALRQAQSHKSEADTLRTRVVSTEERYRTLFDQASEGIIIASADRLQVLELNQTARRLLGLTPTDADRATLESFGRLCKDAGDHAKGGSDWLAALRPHTRFCLVRRDGSSIPVEIDGAPIEIEGQPAYQFFVRELTERARLEQQLRQAEKLSALGQVISGIAHELNNPLAVIEGYLELILARHQLDGETRADLEKVAQESNRAAKLVGNFLSFARERPVHRQLISLNNVIARVAEMRAFDLRIARAELRLELDPDLPQIVADPDQFQQVLVNLVTNALHAVVQAKQPGRLKISTQRRGKHVRVLVEDNGPGVPDSVLPHVFEPFFTTKEVGAGTGLGLSIAHSIMSDHNGRIFYQPSAENGACFVLEFKVPPTAPAVSPDLEPVVQSTPAIAAVPGSKILVLDDEKPLADLLGEMLSMLGHSPTVCYAPVAALEALSRQKYDLILSDFRMPGMDGQQFYRAALERHPELAKRIVFLTGDVVNPETMDFLESIGNPHLGKPFQLDKVEAVIAQVLGEMACAA